MNKPEPQPWDDIIEYVLSEIDELKVEIERLKSTQQEQPK